MRANINGEYTGITEGITIKERAINSLIIHKKSEPIRLTFNYLGSYF